jgi:hypothetical protein
MRAAMETLATRHPPTRTVTVVGTLLLLLLPVSVWGNATHAALMKLSPTDREAMLTTFMRSSGEKCALVTRTFFQGFDSRRNAYWNVRCSDGGAFVIQINSDAQGSTRILECSMMKLVGGGQCFKKF